MHRALPEIDEDEIDTSCRFLGRELNAPFMICAMTGGHPDVMSINLHLAQAASELGIAMGVGSQRAALEDSSLEETFSVVREAAPNVPVIGNIGAVQLKRSGPKIIERLADMIDADAIAVHLNFLQESIQPEGDRDGRGVLDALKAAAMGPVPIIVKETGAGICRETAREIVQAGIKIIDVSGVGGLSWAAVEAFRVRKMMMAARWEAVAGWGVPAVSIASAGRRAPSAYPQVACVAALMPQRAWQWGQASSGQPFRCSDLQQ